MENELIESYILWKRVGILKAIEEKKDFFYGINEKTLKDFSKFAGQKLTIASMKNLEMLVEKNEDKAFVINKETGKQQLAQTWLEGYFMPKVIKFVEENYDKYVQASLIKNVNEYYTKEEFTEEVYKRMYDIEDVEIVDIFGISFSYTNELEFDKKEKIVRYKGDGN